MTRPVELVTPHGVGEVLNARGPLEDDEHAAHLPQVAYAWHPDRYGGWEREDAEEYGVAKAASVFRREGEPSWRGPGGREFPTATAAMSAYDADLIARGWLIDETAARPDRETSRVRRCLHGVPQDTWCVHCGRDEFLEPPSEPGQEPLA